MRTRSDRTLKLIALFRWTKGVLMLAGGVVALRLLNPRFATSVQEWVSRVPRAITLMSRVDVQKVRLLAAGAFAYAALFITEGTGLWLGKRWAEYLTIIATSSLLPFEVYEMIKEVTVLRAVILALNIAIVIYLIWRVRHHE